MNLHPAWLLVVAGAALAIFGLIWIFAPGIPLGRLPGDIRIETGTTRIYIPITTCILISVVLSFALWMVNYFSR
jgi:hypothetical protein